jgi:hypothetical protein
MLSNSQFYFLLACIPSRFILSILPLYLPDNWLVYFGYITLLISLSFIYLYFTNGRLNAPEAGGVTWWREYRIIHGLLYLAASIYLLQKNRKAWIPLIMDTILGIFLFIYKHNFLCNK